MSLDPNKIKRAIASFNNQITRITEIKNSFSVGNKVREHLEDEIKKLVEDRNQLQQFLDKKLSEVTSDISGIKENIVVVLEKADKVDEVTLEELKDLILQQNKTIEKLEKKSISKKVGFIISLVASVIGLAIGIAVGYILP